MRITCDAILFDVDGVLVDSNAIVERQMRGWAGRNGIAFERIAPIHHGRTTVDTIRLVAPHLDAETEADLIERAEADDTEGLLAYDGAARLLAALPTPRWAIVTSATRRNALARLAHIGLPLPRVLIAAEDVAHGKPAPDGYVLAAGQLNLPAARCLVIEDAPAGLAAARAAGARVIAVTSTHAPALLAGADLIVPRLSDLHVEVEDGGLSVTASAAVELTIEG